MPKCEVWASVWYSVLKNSIVPPYIYVFPL
jgi:hypothetical protein